MTEVRALCVCLFDDELVTREWLEMEGADRAGSG